MTRKAPNVQSVTGVARAIARGGLGLCTGHWQRARRLGRRALAVGSAIGLAIGLAAGPGLATTARTLDAATLMADQVYVDTAGRLVASGAVEVWHGSVRLSAQRVVYDRRRDSLQVDGPITISDGPSTMILADAATLSPSLREGLITGARLVLDQQLQITAARVQRQGSRSQMDSVLASSCPVCAADPTPLWEIRAHRVIHDETTDQLHFERAQFRFRGVPILYLPRLRLPGPELDRARGFLQPQVGLTTNLGLTVGLPYFIPFGDSRDLTLTPTVSTTGMASMALRWRRAYRNGGLEIGGQVSHDDLTPADLRGYAYVHAMFNLANDWQLRSDLLVASDRTYLSTYGITDDTRLSGHVTLERVRRDEAIRARALAFHSQRDGDINAHLPNTVAQAELDRIIGLEATPLGGTLRLRLGGQAFQRDSNTPGDLGRDVARAHAQATWRRTGVLPAGVLATAALDARADHVQIDDDPAYPLPVNRRAVQAMVEFRWPWATGTDSGARHVIEPVVQVIASRRDTVALPNEDHTMPELDSGNLFALTRHSGDDAPDDGTRVNAGMRWTRVAPDGWSGEVLAGRIWRRDPLAGFDPLHNQPLGTTRSHWLLAGRVAHGDGLAFDVRMLLDAAYDLARAETNLVWSGQRTELATRYLYLPATPFENRTETLSEWNLDLTQRFQSGWAGVVGWHYDVALAEFASARAGIEFRNECLAFDFTMSHQFATALNPTASTRYNLRFELLGIGGRAPSTPGRTCRG